MKNSWNIYFKISEHRKRFTGKKPDFKLSPYWQQVYYEQFRSWY